MRYNANQLSMLPEDEFMEYYKRYVAFYRGLSDEQKRAENQYASIVKNEYVARKQKAQQSTSIDFGGSNNLRHLSPSKSSHSPKKKKTSILKISIIVLVFFFFIAIIALLFGEKENATSPYSNNTNSSIAPSTDMPVIKGSNAYDITVSLEDRGISGAERAEVSDGYTFTAANSQYSYTISTDENYAISYAKYYIFVEDDGFLAFCASFPYDECDSEAAMQWVNDNIGTEASTTIGDAEFVLSLEESGPTLEIKAIGRDEYLTEKVIG